MFKLIEGLIPPEALAELNGIAAAARYVDGRVSNPHNRAKNNLHIHDPAAQARSAQIMAEALYGHEDFVNFAFPKVIAPPLITAYRPGMEYGLHSDTAFMQLGEKALRADLSCTIFLSDPLGYDGGALRIELTDAGFEFKPAAGSAVIYPSTTLHRVTPVTRGERRVGLTFIESRIADSANRELLYELGEVAALEGLKMEFANYTRIQRVIQNLQRQWGDPD